MARLPEDQPLATINANNGTLFHQSHPSAASENSSTSRYGYAEDDATQSFDGIATTDSRYSLETIATNSSVFLSEEEEVYWEEAWRLFFAVSLSAILLGAVIGNIMVVMVMVKHRGMRTRTNMFLCSLACSDLLCALLNMPISLITVIHGRWVFGTTLCQINGFLTPFTFVTSIHTLMYIAVHKYISIKWPFSHVLTHFRILLMILCAWLWGGVASYLTVHGLNAVSYKPYTTQCGPDYPHDGRTYFHEGFIYLTCYLIPLLVMAFCYIVMCYEIKAHALRMVLATTTDKDVIFMQQRRITFTLFLVLVTFMICWTPHVIYAAYASILKDKGEVPRLANPLVYWLGYLNCACNPIIYALRSPAFREGYRQLFCWKSPRGSRRRHSSGTGQHKPLGRFRAFLRENLRGTLHASGSLTGSPVASPPTSRKSSMTSLTNYLLFPKSRTLSTNSLPGNFRFSVPPLIIDKDTTQVSFIAGIPVLTKGGKIVTYTNPHEKRRTNPVYYPKFSQLERTLIRTDDPTNKHLKMGLVTEKSPLIPATSTTHRGHHLHTPHHHHHHHKSHVTSSTSSSGHAPLIGDELSIKARMGQSMLSPHLEVPEIFIEADIEEELREMGPDMPRFTARPSCESGFNDGDHLSDDENEDQVFIVVADIERPPRDTATTGGAAILISDSSAPPSQTDSEHEALLLDNSAATSSDGEGSRRSAEITEDVSSAELLRVPGAPGVITRQRVCKSVSDACDRKRPVMIGRLVTKSTSDTCIQEDKDMNDRIHDGGTESGNIMKPVEKKSSEKSIRRKFLNRFFSRKNTTNSKSGSSPKSSAHSSRIDIRSPGGGGEIVDDISDSGMVSGVSGMHDSPAIPRANRRHGGKEIGRDATSHSFSMADSKHRTFDGGGGHRAATLDNRSSAASTGSGICCDETGPDVADKGAEVGQHRALALSRSSSDPSMSSSKSKQPGVGHSKHRTQHDKRASKARSKSRRSHDKSSKRRSRDNMELNLTHSGGVASTGHRSGGGGGGDLQRSKSMKAGKYPSVEKLDRERIGSEASAVKRKLKRTGGSSAVTTTTTSLEVARGGVADVTSGHVVRQQELLAAQMMELQPLKVFHYTDAQYMRRYRHGGGHKLYRCVSDPGLTFKKIEEKVLQRSATRKWQRTHKRYQRRTTTNASCSSGGGGKDTTLNLTSDTTPSDQDYRSLAAMDSSILTSSSTTSKSPDGPSGSADHSNNSGDTARRFYASASASPSNTVPRPPEAGSERLYHQAEVMSSLRGATSGGSGFHPHHHGTTASSHREEEERSGKYLLVSVPLNETSPICLSNLSLHHIQPEHHHGATDGAILDCHHATSGSQQPVSGHMVISGCHVIDTCDPVHMQHDHVQQDPLMMSTSASLQITHDPSRQIIHDPSRQIIHDPSRQINYDPSASITYDPSSQLRHDPCDIVPLLACSPRDGITPALPISQQILYNPSAPNFSAIQHTADFVDDSPNGSGYHDNKENSSSSKLGDMCSITTTQLLETDDANN